MIELKQSVAVNILYAVVFRTQGWTIYSSLRSAFTQRRAACRFRSTRSRWTRSTLCAMFPQWQLSRTSCTACSRPLSRSSAVSTRTWPPRLRRWTWTVTLTTSPLPLPLLLLRRRPLPLMLRQNVLRVLSYCIVDIQLLYTIHYSIMQYGTAAALGTFRIKSLYSI